MAWAIALLALGAAALSLVRSYEIEDRAKRHALTAMDATQDLLKLPEHEFSREELAKIYESLAMRAAKSIENVKNDGWGNTVDDTTKYIERWLAVANKFRNGPGAS